MTLRYNIAGQIYDDVVPCFLVCGDLVYNRVDGKWYDLVFIANWAYQHDYNWGPNEYGPIPDGYDISGINTVPYGPPDPGVALLVATTTQINQRTYSIEFSGGPTDAKCYLDFDCEFTNNKTLSANIEFPEGTDDETAAGIIDAIKDTDMYTSRDGNTVYLIGKNKDFLSLTAVIVQGAAPNTFGGPMPLPTPQNPPQKPYENVALYFNFDENKNSFAISGGPLMQSQWLHLDYVIEVDGVPQSRAWLIEIRPGMTAEQALQEAINAPLSDVKLEQHRGGRYRLKPTGFFKSDLKQWSAFLSDVANPFG